MQRTKGEPLAKLISINDITRSKVIQNSCNTEGKHNFSVTKELPLSDEKKGPLQKGSMEKGCDGRGMVALSGKPHLITTSFVTRPEPGCVRCF